MMYKKPRLIFSDRLPDPADFGPHAILIYDRILVSRVLGFLDWARRFKGSYGVLGGEKLKALAKFPHHMENILKLTADSPPRNLVIVVVGGGSVGDFGGFVASVLKRGVELVQIPSTWLSSLDSAHGGKNALNARGIKNQIGTFHFPAQVHLVRKLLMAQEKERADDAFGELAKITLLGKSGLWKDLARWKEKEGKLIWRALPQAIDLKYEIVARDPYELKGPRRLLNLGHTLGHAFESYYGLSHGRAVSQGLLFASAWSHRKGLLKDRDREEIDSSLRDRFSVLPLTESPGFKPIPFPDFLRLIQADKKRISDTEISEVFLTGIGKPRLLKVTLEEMIEEARLQKWV